MGIPGDNMYLLAYKKNVAVKRANYVFIHFIISESTF